MTMWSGGSGPVQQRLHRRQEGVGDGAADAAVRQLDQVVLGAAPYAAAEQQFAIDAEVAELVDDHRQPAALRLGQQVTDQRRLAGAEEAGDDGGGNLHGAESFSVRGRPAATKITRSAAAATR